jgi:hypothetical protein
MSTITDFIKSQVKEVAKRQPVKKVDWSGQTEPITKLTTQALDKKKALLKSKPNQTPVKDIPAELSATGTPIKPPTDKEKATRNAALYTLQTTTNALRNQADKITYVKKQLGVPSIVPYSEVLKTVPSKDVKMAEAKFKAIQSPVEAMATLGAIGRTFGVKGKEKGGLTKEQALEQIYLQDQLVTQTLKQERLSRMTPLERDVDKAYQTAHQFAGGFLGGLTGLDAPNVDDPDGIIEKIAFQGGNFAGFIVGIKGIGALTPKATSVLGHLAKGGLDFTIIGQAHQFARNESLQEHLEALPRQALEGIAFSVIGIGEAKLPYLLRVPAAGGIWTGIAKSQGATWEDAAIQGALMATMSAFNKNPAEVDTNKLIKEAETTLKVRRNATPKEINKAFVKEMRKTELGTEADLQLQASKIILLNQGEIPKALNLFKEQRFAEYGEGIKKGKRVGIEEPGKLKKGTSKIAKSIEKKAVEKDLTYKFSELAEFDRITVKDQAYRATTLINGEINRARAMIRGEESMLKDLNGVSLVTAMETYIKKNIKNTELALDLSYELANSPLIAETSKAGQTLRLAAERTKDSATARLQNLKKAREARAQKRQTTTIEKKRSKLKSSAKESVKKINLTEKEGLSWGKFIDNITC